MSKTITTTTQRYGSEMVACKMRLRVKNALLHKLGFVQPPYFYIPWSITSRFLLRIASTKQQFNA